MCSKISAVCSSCFYHILLLCLVIFIIAIHFCMVSWTLTSPNFNVFRIDWPMSWQSHLHLLTVFPSLHWLPLKFRTLFKISLLTYKMLHEKQPVYFHSMLAASLASHSLRSNKGISLSVPRVKTNTGTRPFHSCAPSLWNNPPLFVLSVATFKKHLKTHLFDLSLPP